MSKTIEVYTKEDWEKIFIKEVQDKQEFRYYKEQRKFGLLTIMLSVVISIFGKWLNFPELYLIALFPFILGGWLTVTREKALVNEYFFIYHEVKEYRKRFRRIS